MNKSQKIIYFNINNGKTLYEVLDKLMKTHIITSVIPTSYHKQNLYVDTALIIITKK